MASSRNSHCAGESLRPRESVTRNRSWAILSVPTLRSADSTTKSSPFRTHVTTRKSPGKSRASTEMTVWVGSLSFSHSTIGTKHDSYESSDSVEGDSAACCLERYGGEEITEATGQP